MKLLLCPHCSDVRKLGWEITYCRCGKSYGFYEDEINALVGGLAIPLGIDNVKLVKAVHNKPHKHYSKKDEFTAWVIAEPCPTLKRMRLK